MKKVLFAFLLSFLSARSFAGVAISLGQLVLNQRNNLTIDEPQTADQFAAGYAWDQYQIGLEYARFATTESGNQTLSMKTKSYSLQVVGQLKIRNEKLLRPYLSTGFGFEQVQTRTSLYSSISEDQSRFYVLGFAGVGLRFQFLEAVCLATEGRLNFGEIRDPNPAWSMLLNLGINF